MKFQMRDGVSVQVSAARCPPIPEEKPHINLFDSMNVRAARQAGNIRRAWAAVGRVAEVEIVNGTGIIRSDIGPYGVPLKRGD